MAYKDASREAHFPAIERRYGEKMAYWFKVMAKLSDAKYAEQVAHLRENFGFSQAHANALVMHSRGSKSAKRFETQTAFNKSVTSEQARTIRAIFKVIINKYPQAELVIAWNQPMLRINGQYVFGASASSKRILISPWSANVIADFAPRMSDLVVLKKTIGIPNDWKVDSKLILSLVKARLAEVK